MPNPLSPVTPTQQPTSIASSTPSGYEVSTPILPRLLKVHRSIGKAGEQATHHILDSLEAENKSLQLWSKEQLDQLQKKANLSWQTQAWSYVGTVASAVSSIFSFVAGYYYITTNQDSLRGIAAIALGTFNIVQTFFTQQKICDWISETLAEKNQTIQDFLKMGLPFALFCFNLAASYANNRYIRSIPHHNLLSYLETAQELLFTGSQMGNSYLSIQSQWSEAELVKIQAELNKHQNNASLFSHFLNDMIQEMKRVKSAVKKPIYALMQATTLASQKV